MGGPLLLAVALFVLLLIPLDPGSSHAAARPLLAAAIGVLLGCRLAYHLHMRALDAYGGAYTDPEKFRRARRRCMIMCVVYGKAGGYLAHLLAEL